MMRAARRTSLAFLFILGFLRVGPSLASCDAGGTPGYGDIVAVEAYRFSLVGGRSTIMYFLNVGRFDKLDNSSAGVRYTSFVRPLKKNAQFPRGTYESSDSAKLFDSVVAVLKARGFFGLHFPLSQVQYIDGPEDYLAVSRCGTQTIVGAYFPQSQLGGPPTWRMISAGGPQWNQLQATFDDIYALVSATPWTVLPSPSPAPRPSSTP
jgi:hypothetical protein